MKLWFLKRNGVDSQILEQCLKEKPPVPAISPAQHDSIMQTVRNASRVPEPEIQSPRRLRMALAGVGVMSLLLALLLIRFSPDLGSQASPQPQSALSMPGSALEVSGLFVHEASAAAVSPLYDEMQCLHRDFTNTEQFILASLP